MYGRIFGFHRLERWPKWTPDSTNSLTRVVDTNETPKAHRLCVASSVRTGDSPALAGNSAKKAGQNAGPFGEFEPCSLSESRQSVHPAHIARPSWPGAEPGGLGYMSSGADGFQAGEEGVVEAAVGGQHAAVGVQRAALREVEGLAIEVADLAASFFDDDRAG